MKTIGRSVKFWPRYSKLNLARFLGRSVYEADFCRCSIYWVCLLSVMTRLHNLLHTIYFTINCHSIVVEVIHRSIWRLQTTVLMTAQKSTEIKNQKMRPICAPWKCCNVKITYIKLHKTANISVGSRRNKRSAIFTARTHCRALYTYNNSVCPSVTRRYPIQTNEHRITRSSL